MQCRKHPADLSSGVGICASCLRHRLLAITEPQKQRNCAKLDAYQPPPLSFPRSVSPTETTTVPWTWSLYTTPQLAVGVKKTKSSGGAFSKLLLGLFRSKSYKHDLDSNPGVSVDSCSSTSHSNTYINPRRREMKIRSFWMERRACRNPNRERYSGGSSESFHQTPRRTPAAGHSRTISGLAFFLSPLVRPRNQNGVPASFCKNRSRKFADFGRHNSRH